MSWPTVASTSLPSVSMLTDKGHIEVSMKREVGATVTEYALLVAGIAVALVAVFLLLQGALTESLNESADCVESAITSEAENCPGGGQE